MIAWVAVAWGQQVQPYPIDVERFKPPSDTFGYVNTESAATLGHLQVGVGMWGNHSRDSLVLLRNGERVIGPSPNLADAMLDERSIAHFQVGMGFFDRVSLTLDLPVVLWQAGFEPSPVGVAPSAIDLEPSGVGDLRISPKVVLLESHKNMPLGIAISAPISVPTGSERSFLGEGGPTASPVLAVELADGSVQDREHHVRFALNAGARFKETDDFRGLPLGTEFVYRAGVAVQPTPVLELGTEINGAVAGPETAQAPLEILPFLRFLPAETVTLTVGAGMGLIEGAGSPDIRGFVGGTLAPKFDPLSLDRDKDGIPNKYDQCISIPEDADGFEDEDGCPEDDNDGDGIPDASDRCPNEPEDRDTFQDDDGCPDPDNDGDGILDVSDRCPLQAEDFDGFQDLDGCPDTDNDADGFLDTADACPNAAETVNGFEDGDGCPDEKPHVDSDGDGLVDEVDRCPLDPEDFDTFQDDDGCPDPDNDLDGIFDVVDQCPFEAETRNQYKDEDGCPDEKPSRVVLQKTRIDILEKVFFEVNKSVIRDVSFTLLDEVATVMIDHPNLTRIRVEGHTDSDGSESYNERLSQARAEAVVDYLVNRGVDRARLEPVGFGESRPIDSNRTPEGKQNNRRVEFVIVEQQ